jgi:hypothetical protein
VHWTLSGPPLPHNATPRHCPPQGNPTPSLLGLHSTPSPPFPPRPRPQHITPQRLRNLAALRHLTALTLGCPAPGYSPGSGTGFQGDPGFRLQAAVTLVGAPSYGAATAVTDGCVRELVTVLVRNLPSATAAHPGPGSGSASGSGSGFGFGYGAAGGMPCRSGPVGQAAAGPGLRKLSLAHCVHVSDAGGCRTADTEGRSRGVLARLVGLPVIEQ